jgi:hypothetical protein
MYSRKNERLLFRANEIDVDDLTSHSVDAILSTPVKTKRASYKQQGEFIRGPIPVAWLTVAVAISPAAAYLGVVLWHLARMRQEPIVLSYVTLTRYGFQPRHALRLLRALASACLITLDVAPGRAPRVRLIREVHAAKH